MVPTVAPVAPASTPPEVSIHKTVGPHPASAGASPPCLPLGYCPALRGTASFPGAGHPREGQQASLLGDKYLLLEALEGSSLHRCLHIQTQEELVCKVTSPSYLIPPSQLVAFPFPSYLIYIEHRNSFLDPSIGSHLSIPCPFTILSHLPFPINSPILYWSLGPATRVARCSNVQLIAVLLHFCAIASIVIFAPAESILDQQLASGGATSAPTGLPRNSSRTSLRRIRDQNFQFSGLFFIRFSASTAQQPSSGSAWQRLLRFGGELSESRAAHHPQILAQTRNFPTLF